MLIGFEYLFSIKRPPFWMTKSFGHMAAFICQIRPLGTKNWRFVRNTIVAGFPPTSSVEPFEFRFIAWKIVRSPGGFCRSGYFAWKAEGAAHCMEPSHITKAFRLQLVQAPASKKSPGILRNLVCRPNKRGCFPLFSMLRTFGIEFSRQFTISSTLSEGLISLDTRSCPVQLHPSRFMGLDLGMLHYVHRSA